MTLLQSPVELRGGVVKVCMAPAIIDNEIRADQVSDNMSCGRWRKLQAEEKYTQYQVLTYLGRQLADRDDPGYCGTCDISIHIAQLDDPNSWVHSSVDRWYRLAINQPRTHEF